MKKQQLKVAILSLIAVLLLLFIVLKKLPEASENKTSYKSELTEIKNNQETQISEITSIKTNSTNDIDFEETIDSLKTLLNNYQNKYPQKLNADERELEETIIELNKGYAEMSKTKDVQKVLKHFLPQFTSNIINIGVDEKVLVDRKGSKGYSNRLEDIIEIPGLEIEMGATKFLHLFIKGDVAIAVYLTEYKTLIDNDVIIEGTVLGQATCKRYNGNEYRIGNYSLVNIRDHEIFATQTSVLEETDL